MLPCLWIFFLKAVFMCREKPEKLYNQMITIVSSSGDLPPLIYLYIFWNVYNEHGLPLLKESHKNK